MNTDSLISTNITQLVLYFVQYMYTVWGMMMHSMGMMVEITIVKRVKKKLKKILCVHRI